MRTESTGNYQITSLSTITSVHIQIIKKCQGKVEWWRAFESRVIVMRDTALLAFALAERHNRNQSGPDGKWTSPTIEVRGRELLRLSALRNSTEPKPKATAASCQDTQWPLCHPFMAGLRLPTPHPTTPLQSRCQRSSFGVKCFLLGSNVKPVINFLIHNLQSSWDLWNRLLCPTAAWNVIINALYNLS